jgi:protein phosphatase
MKLEIPALSLVVLVGTTGSGKSTFARRHFLPTEVLSSDTFRGLVADDENDQSATEAAFDALHYIAAKRLEAGRLTVIDATNVQPEARRPLIQLARRYHMLPVAIALDIPEAICEQRNASRPDRQFGRHVLRRQRQALRRSLPGLRKEGFNHVWILRSDEVDDVEVERQPLWNDKRELTGPFDIIGDVHGCADELEELLTTLGYEVAERRDGTSLDAGPVYRHPEGRTVVFLGDLVDRGPRVLDTLRIARNLVEAGAGLCVMGNHEAKFLRALQGRQVQVTHGLGESLAELDALEPAARDALKEELKTWLDARISHYVLDGGALVVAHAGLKAEMHGRGSRGVREFALYGDTTGEIDAFGFPVRLDWAQHYRARATVVYGHTAVPEADWLNGTIDIDTGCVFGGKLTALRYPERELVSVPARRTYYEPGRPFLPEPVAAPVLTAQQRHDDLLDLADVLGKRIVETRLMGKVTVREDQTAAALEVMSRFAVDPKWLIYLPPTMSPSETTSEPGLLEHPREAFAYYRKRGIAQVVCEEKHMGSRAVVVVCRDESVARRRFGVVGQGVGIVYTRTGRRFFDAVALERALLDRVIAACSASGLWDELATDWLCLDAELMPWSAKAQELITKQYAAVGAAARVEVSSAVLALGSASRVAGTEDLLARHRSRLDAVEAYSQAYQRYCWPVRSLDDLRLAPFHLLASEGHVHSDRDHVWHMETLARLATADSGVLMATPFRVVTLEDAHSVSGAMSWWEDLTARGGEGMVVKPLEFVARDSRGLVQPALKCRGREYLRIIYGPEYTAPEHLARLRARGVSAKRSLALREFALGIEALERFVATEPLRRVHECTFGVLALETEPVDPRL